jgi:hypothetical protein
MPVHLVQRQAAPPLFILPGCAAARDPKPPTPPRCGCSVQARAASRVAGRLGISVNFFGPACMESDNGWVHKGHNLL